MQCILELTELTEQSEAYCSEYTLKEKTPKTFHYTAFLCFLLTTYNIYHVNNTVDMQLNT